MHFPRMSLRVILCSVLVGFSAGVLFAQDGKLSGKVADEKTNKPIALAQVTVLQAGVIKSSTTTNTNGVYHFPILTPGEYDLVVTYVGYVKQTVNKVVIRPLKTTFSVCDIPQELQCVE